MNGEKIKQISKKETINTVEKPIGTFRTTMAYNEKSMMCHFIMKKGAKIPLHKHDAVQNGYVIHGKIKFFRKDGNSFIAESGSGYVFDSNEIHGAEALEDSEFVECFSPLRPEFTVK